MKKEYILALHLESISYEIKKTILIEYKDDLSEFYKQSENTLKSYFLRFSKRDFKISLKSHRERMLGFAKKQIDLANKKKFLL